MNRIVQWAVLLGFYFPVAIVVLAEWQVGECMAANPHAFSPVNKLISGGIV